MARFLKDRTVTKGQAPGSLILVGSKKMEKPVIRIMDYNSGKLDEAEIQNIEEANRYISGDSVTWINIYGIHDQDLINKVGDIFNIKSLYLEDIMNTDQMPKYITEDNYDAFILKMLEYTGEKISAEQITIILGKNYVLTLQEKVGDVFDPVRNRIRSHKSRIRLNNNDYLAYALMDVITDNYLHIIEKIGRNVENLEAKIFSNADNDIATEIYRNKIELSYLRKNIRPAKEAVLNMIRNQDSFFSQDTINYMDDLKEALIHATESIELYSNLVSDQLNTHNSLVSNKMNQVMKVLTIFASVFIPLTFIAGIYGMNFTNMPELKLKYGYLLFWILIILVGGLLMIYFKRKKWL